MMHLALQILSLCLVISPATMQGLACAGLCDGCSPVDEYNMDDSSTVFAGCSAAKSGSYLNVTSSSTASFLKILDISNATHVNVKGRNLPGLPEYHSFNWRFSNVKEITINSGSFVDATVNFYIRNTAKLSISKDTFTNCRGSLFLMDISDIFIDSEALSSDSDMTIILQNQRKSTVNIDNRNSIEYSNTLVIRPRQDTSSPEPIAIATMAVGYATLTLSAVIAALLLVILLTLKKLFQQNFESIKLKSMKTQTNKVNVNRQDAPLPLLPR